MTTAEAKIKQWGNSLGIIIPKEVIRNEGLGAGDIIKIEIVKERKIDGFGMLKGAPSFVRDHDDREEFW